MKNNSSKRLFVIIFTELICAVQFKRTANKILKNTKMTNFANINIRLQLPNIDNEISFDKDRQSKFKLQVSFDYG